LTSGVKNLGRKKREAAFQMREEPGSKRQYYSLEAFIDSSATSKGWFTFKEVREAEAGFILKKTGLDVKGYRHSIDKDDILHILKKHGTPKRKNEIAVTKEDVLLIPIIIENPDELIYAGKTSKGRDAIKYSKRVNGIIYIVEEVRTKQGSLSAKTMYKNRVDTTMPDTQTVPGGTS
jgi:hypothetical protein